jgi:tetratricopeptide (TPR) repeat protein
VGAFGEVQVMDWGLAKVLPRESSTPAGESTMGLNFATRALDSTHEDKSPTGVVGTPAYMAPEQARGAGEDIDKRADVFGLGGILCAMLTGKAPFSGRDRAEVMRKAAAGDLANAFSRLEASRADGELVQLARACLAAGKEDRPRDAGVVAARVNAYLASVQQRLRVAEVERAAAQVRAEEAAKSAAAERRARRVQLFLLVAVLLVLAAGIVGTTWGMLRAEKALVSESEQQEKTYLEKTLKRWQVFAQRKGEDERSRRIRAEGEFKVAVLRSRLGQIKEAIAGYLKGLNIQQKLVAEFPRVPEYRQDLAASHNNLGLLWAGQKQPEQAAEHHRRALDIKQKLAAEFLAVPGYRQDLAASHNNLGNLLAAQPQPEMAAEHDRKALDIQQNLAAGFPGVPEYQVDLGGGYCNLGLLLFRTSKASDCLPWFNKAITTLNRIHQQNQQAVLPRLYLRNSYLGRANAYDRLEKHAEAVKDWTRVIELSPPREQAGFRAQRANSGVRAGQVAEAVGDVAELTRSSTWAGGHWYCFACIYAVASSQSTGKKKEYADRAMELLLRAVQAGFKDTAHMTRDRDLDVLRQRDDFKKLLNSLAKPKEKKASAPHDAELSRAEG